MHLSGLCKREGESVSSTDSSRRCPLSSRLQRTLFSFLSFLVFSVTCFYLFINISLCVAKAVLERNVYEEQKMGRRGNNEECDVKELGFSAMLLQLLCWSVIY